MGFRCHAAVPHVAIDGDKAVIRVPDKHFDPEDGQSDGQPLSRLVSDLGRYDVVLDFENVRFVGSLGLATLIALHKQLATAGRRLTLVNVCPRVYDTLALTRLTTLLNVRQQEEAAPPACELAVAPIAGLA